MLSMRVEISDPAHSLQEKLQRDCDQLHIIFVGWFAFCWLKAIYQFTRLITDYFASIQCSGTLLILRGSFIILKPTVYIYVQGFVGNCLQNFAWRTFHIRICDLNKMLDLKKKDQQSKQEQNIRALLRTGQSG